MLIKFNVCTGSTQLARSWVEPVHRLHPVSSELLLRRVLAGRRRRRRNARAPLLAPGPRRAKAALALLLADAPRGLSVAFTLPPPPEYLAGLGCLGLRRFRHRRQRRLRPWLRPTRASGIPDIPLHVILDLGPRLGPEVERAGIAGVHDGRPVI